MVPAARMMSPAWDDEDEDETLGREIRAAQISDYIREADVFSFWLQIRPNKTAHVTSRLTLSSC